MKNMKIPSRPAPSVEEARHKKSVFSNGLYKKNSNQQCIKKKPPPRPPPPDFSKIRSKSAWNLNNTFENVSLIDWSPPRSPKNITHRSRPFGGSISSSYSSSTSSLASSKKSFEYETVPFNNAWICNAPQTSTATSYSTLFNNSQVNNHVPAVAVAAQVSAPTIIRAQPLKRYTTRSKYESTYGDVSSPMPSIPPPSPPKEIAEVTIPYGVAVFDYPATHYDDLLLQVNDVVFLTKRLNNDWYYGRVDDREGMFPCSFIEVKVPLLEDERTVTALYEFPPQRSGDLALQPGQSIYVISRVSADWLIGESNGKRGQFPSSFVDRVPEGL